jgi:hypothetical protein
MVIAFNETTPNPGGSGDDYFLVVEFDGKTKKHFRHPFKVDFFLTI